MSSPPDTNPGVNWAIHEDSHEVAAIESMDSRGEPSRAGASTLNALSLSSDIPVADAREVHWTPARNPSVSKRSNLARPMSTSLGYPRSMRAKPVHQVHPTRRLPITPLPTTAQIRSPETALPPLIPQSEPIRFHRCYRSGCDGLGFPHKAAFEQHLRVHRQADKPHPCPYPGCHRGFDFALEVNEHFQSLSIQCARSSPHGIRSTPPSLCLQLPTVRQKVWAQGRALCSHS